MARNLPRISPNCRPGDVCRCGWASCRRSSRSSRIPAMSAANLRFARELGIAVSLNPFRTRSLTRDRKARSRGTAGGRHHPHPLHHLSRPGVAARFSLRHPRLPSAPHPTRRCSASKAGCRRCRNAWTSASPSIGVDVEVCLAGDSSADACAADHPAAERLHSAHRRCSRGTAAAHRPARYFSTQPSQEQNPTASTRRRQSHPGKLADLIAVRHDDVTSSR